MTAHDCAQQGHVWLEDDGNVPYRRHRARAVASVSCTCQHCGLSAELPGHGAFTAPPGPHPVDHKIPAPFLKVLDAAVKAAPEERFDFQRIAREQNADDMRAFGLKPPGPVREP
jgi:hypothetical protein